MIDRIEKQLPRLLPSDRRHRKPGHYRKALAFAGVGAAITALAMEGQSEESEGILTRPLKRRNAVMLGFGAAAGYLMGPLTPDLPKP